MNRFRPAQQTDVSAQFKAGAASLKGEVKFLKFIDKSSWLDGMETIKRTILHSMILDEEVALSQANSFTLIDSLRAALQRFDRGVLDRCNDTLEYSTECDTHKPELQNSNSNEGETSDSQTEVKADNVHVSDMPSVSNEPSEEEIMLNQTNTLNLNK